MLEGSEEGVELREGGAVSCLNLTDGRNAAREITLKGDRWNRYLQASEASHANAQASLAEYETPSHPFGSTLVKQGTHIVRVRYTSVYAKLNAVRLVQGDRQPFGLDAGTKVGITHRPDQNVAWLAFVSFEPLEVTFGDERSVVVQEPTHPDVLEAHHAHAGLAIVLSLEIGPEGAIREFRCKFAEGCAGPSSRVLGRIAEHLKENGLREDVESGEASATRGSQCFRPVQYLCNPPLFR
jgi:hypothetical protein